MLHHAFEALTVHVNGEVVCSIIDGRGDFVLGNVHPDTLGRYGPPRALPLPFDFRNMRMR